ncbi:MAG: aromatic amino acid lyase [Beijerinckiaceae bacterium]|nr:aromatic amino acid lyase [Beijerinckiaceae bacterium]
MKLLGDTPLTIFDLAAIVNASDPIGLSEKAYGRVDAARKIVDAFAEGEQPIYGLNTGLGGNLGYRISPEDIRAFQEQLIRGRNIGVGEPLPEPLCRAALLARIIGIGSGGAGISRATLALLIEMFNRGLTPVIPARGTISAADLGLSAHIGGVLIGRAEAWFDGERLPGGEALRRAGLSPAKLEPKDGLAMCNSSAPSIGHVAMTLVDLGDTLACAAAAAALSYQGYGANPTIFDARINAARPAVFQREAGAMFRALLAESSIYENPGKIQDAVSFRCLAPLFGSTFGAFAQARQEVEVEINGATDTPLVLIEDEVMLSAPNFQTQSLALAIDTLRISLAHLAAAGAHRIMKLMNPTLSGLPKYLSPIGGASAGYVPMQKTTAGLHAEIRHAAAPATLDALPVSDTVEDCAPLTLLAVRKLAEQLVSFKLLVAVEATVAAQAIDLREGLRLSSPSGALHRSIRDVLPMLETDRETGLDVMAVADVLDDRKVTSDILASIAAVGLPIVPAS